MTEDYIPEKMHPASRLLDHGEERVHHPAVNSVLKFFAYAHLPPHLQEVSKEFFSLAHKVADRSPDSPETTVALRKLLEAKDAAVRAAFF